jgi:hypothetical protein
MRNLTVSRGVRTGAKCLLVSAFLALAACGGGGTSGEETGSTSAPLSVTHPQIVWWDQVSGGLQAWDVSGATRTNFFNFSASLDLPADSNWTFVGIADFNGDGNGDLLLYNGESGALQVWYLNGVARTGIGNFAAGLDVPLTLGWGVAGIADFNGDGKPDILFHNVNGASQVWFMNGIVRTSVTPLAADLNTAESTGWIFEGAADFNGDGHPDILIHNITSGATQVWYMNGVNRTSLGNFSSGLNTPDTTGWTFSGIADYNGDGKPDLLFWNTISGALQIWYLNGIVRTSAAPFPSNLIIPSSMGWVPIVRTSYLP